MARRWHVGDKVSIPALIRAWYSTASRHASIKYGDLIWVKTPYQWHRLAVYVPEPEGGYTTEEGG